ncbi:MAG: rod shape-determining protein RodA [Bacteroidota bacterium]|nr:rod shape-determining protein RodA [Bacteroidota bacterium]
MRKAKNIFENIDGVSIILYIILVFFGWINIYASQYNDDNIIILDLASRHGKQLIFIGVAFLIAFLILIIDWKFFDVFSYFFYGLIILLLIGVLLIGEATNDSVSWFEIGRFKIQPSEFAKFITALALAKYFNLQEKSTRLRKKLTAYLIIFVPFLLIVLQNDTGTALVFLAFSLVLYREGMSGNILILGVILFTLLILTFLMNKVILSSIFSVLAIIILFFSRKRKKEIQFIIICWGIIIGSIFSISYISEDVLLPHHTQRIKILLGQEIDPQGAGYNLIQSKIAIGAGGLFGKGFLNGTQTRFDFVPEQSTDFIFCTIGEEWGFVGSLVFIACFISLILRTFFIAERQRSNFSRIYAYSVGCILFIHFVINIGMTIGLFPVIGIPLPFISYGGSSLIGFTILLFILLNLDSYRLQILR